MSINGGVKLNLLIMCQDCGKYRLRIFARITKKVNADIKVMTHFCRRCQKKTDRRRKGLK